MAKVVLSYKVAVQLKVSYVKKQPAIRALSGLFTPAFSLRVLGLELW